MVGHKVHDDAQAGLVGAHDKLFELLHPLFHLHCQIGIHVVVVLNGIRASGLTFHHHGVVTTDAEVRVVGLRGMLYDAGVPHVGDAEILDFAKGFRREVGHRAASVLGLGAAGRQDLVLRSEEAGENLIDRHTFCWSEVWM